MKTYTVTYNNNGNRKSVEFSTYNEANTYFMNLSDEKGLDYQPNESGAEVQRESGKRDHSVELTINQ